MLLPVIGVSHKDLLQAIRLMKWMWFLSRQNRNSMRGESVLLVPSRGASSRDAYRHLIWLATQCFGQVYSFTPPTEHETGWPGACNHLFQQAIEHVEAAHYADMLWIEPDAIPVTHDWFEVLQAAWDYAQQSGKTFMGDYVTTGWAHMSGVAVYGSGWRLLAPRLIDVPESMGWDLYSSHQVVPHAYFTQTIQHIWKNPVITSSDILLPETVLFHQDKEGRLIKVLDQERYSGEVDRDPNHSYSNVQEIPTMRRFYEARNANRRIKSQGFEFIFQPYAMVAGTWKGLYTTEEEGEIAALNALVADPRNAVTEIDQVDYELKAKKKLPGSPNSGKWSPVYPQAKLKQSPALLVEDPSTLPGPAVKQELGKPIEDIEQVLVVDVVKPAIAPTPKPKPKSGRRKSDKV